MSEPRTIDLRVTDIIKEIGVPAHLKGYYYVRDAILLVIENDEFIRAVSTNSLLRDMILHHTGCNKLFHIVLLLPAIEAT